MVSNHYYDDFCFGAHTYTNNILSSYVAAMRLFIYPRSSGDKKFSDYTGDNGGYCYPASWRNW